MEVWVLPPQSGWMNSELCVLEHFIEHMGVYVTKRGVLVMDIHESHIYVEVVEMARERVVYCNFPPTLQSSNAALRCRSIRVL